MILSESHRWHLRYSKAVVKRDPVSLQEMHRTLQRRREPSTGDGRDISRGYREVYLGLMNEEVNLIKARKTHVLLYLREY